MAYIKGVWKWNDVVYCDHSTHYWYTIAFISNGTQFKGICGEWGTGYHYLSYCEGENYSGKQTLVGASIAAGDDFFSVKEAYRIMVFGEEQNIDDELYEFISANAHELTEAEKLLMIAENEQKVFNSGRDEGYQDGYDSGHGDGYTEGFDAGKQAEYDAFWDAFQRNGSRNSYVACFGGDNWNNGLLNPKYPITPTANGSYLFYSNSMGGDLVEYFKNIGKVLDLTNVGNANSTFQYSQFTRIGKIYHNESNWYSAFYGCSKLVTIDEVGNSDENGNAQFATSTFTGCSALINITIRGKITGNTDLKDSKQLSKASITNIINHLSDTASGKTLTLSKTAVDNAWAWEDWDGSMQPGSTDGAWVELKRSKSNWAITLV